MAPSYPLTILVPARAEEATIVGTLEGLERHVKTPHRILVLNDRVAKTDQTAGVVRRFARGHSNVAVIVLNRVGATTPGFGAAIREGIGRARTGYVVIVMADQCDDPGDIDSMLAKAQRGYDVVCGSRYMSGGKKSGGPLLQGVASWLVNIFLRLVVGVPIWDSSNAFKLYKRNILTHCTIEPTMGVEASLHLFLQAYFAGARIAEIPTAWRGRAFGKSTFLITHRGFPYARIVWRAVKKKFFGHQFLAT